MSRKPKGPDSDLLFDLPLDRPAADDEAEAAEEATAPDDAFVRADQEALAFVPEEEGDVEPPRPVEAAPAERLLSTLIDLAVLAVVLGLSLVALRLFDVPIDRAVAAPLALFLGSFSFLYQVMPLAFWGHTPGMAYFGLHSRDREGGFMTMQQCILRWAAWLVTVASGGLAGLLALSGVSLADLASGTRTYRR